MRFAELECSGSGFIQDVPQQTCKPVPRFIQIYSDVGSQSAAEVTYDS